MSGALFRGFQIARSYPRASLLWVLALAACAPLSPDISVRHFGSTQFHEGARFHLFTFDPREPRTLDQRIRLAKADPQTGCGLRRPPPRRPRDLRGLTHDMDKPPLPMLLSGERMKEPT